MKYPNVITEMLEDRVGDTDVVAQVIFRFEITQITKVWVHYFKSFSRVKSTQDKMAYFFVMNFFFSGNELKLTQNELFPFFRFKSVTEFTLLYRES